MMSKKKFQITCKQRKVLDKIFTDDLSLEEIFEEFNISPERYIEWFTQDTFVDEFTRRLNLGWIKSKIILAKYAISAVAKLVELTQGKTEIARKACNDILSYQFKELQLVKKPLEPEEVKSTEKEIVISPEMHTNILKYLAEHTTNKCDKESTE